MINVVIALLGAVGIIFAVGCLVVATTCFIEDKLIKR